MNIGQIAEKIKILSENIDHAEFLFSLLECYGKPKASITRLRMDGKGSYNLSRTQGEILWKKQVYFKQTDSEQLLTVIDEMKHSEAAAKHQPRFIIAINSSHLLAIDTKELDTLDTPLSELDKKFDFFLPWAGLEKTQARAENMADVKAAEKMAKLFDLLRESNPANTAQEIHWQNVFLSRILFCFFAEDTGIFESKLFTNHIASHTGIDGNDLGEYLGLVFEVMNQESRARTPAYLADFPYVNGGLFADKFPIPKFTKKSRAILIECGSELNWSEISPDIFGSMIQAVVDPSQRGNMGMHYTSAPNIMKVIEPLFLNELKGEFDKHADSVPKLEQLLLRLEHLKIFDPACGSGNFLIIAYKELRKLEIDIFKRLQKISKHNLIPLSRIKLSQFYGIELDDFAHEIAILSMWLAEHQMNLKFKATFGHTHPALPLKSSGNIICKSSNEVEWEKFCPPTNNSEVYTLGNPPYLGARTQDPIQKAEMQAVLGHLEGANSLDYIASWFYKGAQFVEAGSKAVAFVSTNSITQGEQVALLWPHILEEMDVCINFAHTSFKWSNNAKNKAGVTCVVVGLAKNTTDKRMLYSGDFAQQVSNISPYLTDTKNIYVYKRTKPLSKIPEMAYGNQPIEGGFLILTPVERDHLVAEDGRSGKFIRPLIGGNEFLKGQERWCLWIEDAELNEALAIPPIKRRIDAVREFRENGGQVASSLVGRSHQFRYRHRARNSFILLPCTSSEKRDYLQLGFFDAEYLTTHSAQILYDADPYIFGIISSRAHMLWTKAVGGCLESRIRYSNLLCYNNFPIPDISEKKKEQIRSCVFEVLAKREGYPEQKISDLYDPEKMPRDLLEAHRQLDLAVLACYDRTEFRTDDDLLAYLFKLYEKMTRTHNA
ncbi:DNA methyltransferase [Achromobacter xylosoxidans]|uniref:DNA methyltransferase n=1 Tax=Alcaligenes xylosoxydans xylosoxydans TaxID=85698 RepID=UPI0006C8A47A|nr:DNA methyltransferase [Achromobacter xylosoxidans]